MTSTKLAGLDIPPPFEAERGRPFDVLSCATMLAESCAIFFRSGEQVGPPLQIGQEDGWRSLRYSFAQRLTQGGPSASRGTCVDYCSFHPVYSLPANDGAAWRPE